ncbi:branched-chain alpha-keto acid dehydrogenase subunit E2, partial [Modestobacter sp. VKM Ac-2676]
MAELHQFRLPDVGEGLTEGEILSWMVAVGDTVAVNQPLCEVETAKAAVELPSPFAGTVVELLHEVGTTVDVGAPIITIDTGGSADDTPAARPRPRSAPPSWWGTGRAPPSRGAVPAGARCRLKRTTGPAPTTRPCWPPRRTPGVKPVRHGGLEAGRAAEAQA